MSTDAPYSTGIFETITNVHFGTSIYVVVAASHGDFAVPTKKGVKVLARQSDGTTIIGGDGTPVTGTLLECPTTAGANAFRLRTSFSVGDLGGAELVFGFALPKKPEILSNWFQNYVVPVYQGSAIYGPYLWWFGGDVGVRAMGAETPAVFDFKVRSAPHLAGNPDSKIVQVYPTSGVNLDANGWGVVKYRTDKKGAGTVFVPPLSWSATLGLGNNIPFGNDPPLIGGDTPAP